MRLQVFDVSVLCPDDRSQVANFRFEKNLSSVEQAWPANSLSVAM